MLLEDQFRARTVTVSRARLICAPAVKNEDPNHAGIWYECRTSKALRVRIDGRWDVDIPKEMIVRVEADNHGVPEPSSLEPSEETLA